MILGFLSNWFPIRFQFTFCKLDIKCYWSDLLLAVWFQRYGTDGEERMCLHWREFSPKDLRGAWTSSPHKKDLCSESANCIWESHQGLWIAASFFQGACEGDKHTPHPSVAMIFGINQIRLTLYIFQLVYCLGGTLYNMS